MKTRFIPVLLLIALLFSLTGAAQATPAQSPDQRSLVYVTLSSPDDLTRFATTGLPSYGLAGDGLLTGASPEGQQALQEAGLNYRVLAPLNSGPFYLAMVHPSRAALDYSAYGQVLLSLPKGALLRMDPAQVNPLTQAGAELQAISLTPKALPDAPSQALIPAAVTPNPIIQGIIDQVTVTQVYTYDRQLAGELPVWVDGSWYTIPTRYTFSGTPIQKTTKYVGQHMADLGMSVEYHNWSGPTYPNVIGQITGQTNPNDIYIIGGHLDDVQGAPGADDNASGSVATLLAADLLSKYQWGCTLRFAFWTGEEQGLLGSAVYAKRAHDNGENILGYLNLDMIAWNTPNTSPTINLSYSTGIPESLLLAQLYSDVIDAYNLNLIPIYDPNVWGSDHNSFWDYGFNSILAIEDFGDFNPYYHSWQDTPAHTDPAYFTDFVKASLATFVHLNGCMLTGNLDGHVTDASSGLPLQNALLTADNGLGNVITDTTDASGYYTMTLPAGTYTVTSTADTYVPQVVNSTVNAGEVTTQDFALEQCVNISGLDFSWLPSRPFYREEIAFDATANGTLPIDYQWSFGDGHTGMGDPVSHTYASAGTFTVTLAASNYCSVANTTHQLTLSELQQLLLPMLFR